MSSGPASFSTSPALKGKNDREKKSPDSPLILPTYSSASKIKYPTFIRDLQKRNPKLKEVTQAEAQRALRQYFVNYYGREDFEEIRRAGERVPQTDKDKTAWAWLREESQQYWQRR